MDGLLALSERDWHESLAWCDRTQLTLPLAYRHRDILPPFVQTRLDTSLASNRERTRRLEHTVAEILTLLAGRGIEPVLLKGFAHTPDFFPDPAWRVQYDLDLLLSHDEALAARDALCSIGYEPIEQMESFPTDHLPVLIRKTAWQWRGDHFDPEAPLSVDLHFRLWDWETEGFDAPGWQEFRQRAVRQRWRTVEFRALDCADAIGYAALHALRHLLRGSLRPFHAYEIAAFLHTHAEDHELWTRWLENHDDALRRAEAVLFAIGYRWFGPSMHAVVRDEIAALPEEVTDWFHRFAAAPIEALFHSNKQELWLHLALLEPGSPARRIVVRRLFPMRLPGPVDASILLPDSQLTWRIRVRRAWNYAIHLLARIWHHTRTLPAVAIQAGPWICRRMGLCEGFARYLATSCLFSAGVFVFLLLYNLHLLDLGYREDFLGQVSASMTIGSIAGTLPAGWLAHRYGLRVTLLATLSAVVAVSVARTLVTAPAFLLATAFTAGIAMSGWAIQFMPAVAQLTTPAGRARGFSLFASVGIATGAVAGLVGGRLPRWIAGLGGAPSRADARQWALLLGCALIAAAMIPAWKLEFQEKAQRTAKSYPATNFVFRFLAALSVWHLATGAFNPFFNAWLVRHAGASQAATGTVFAASQLTQVLALLAAPAVLRRLGVIRGVAAMQAVTAVSLAACAMAGGVPFAAAGYVAYMAAQYMSEPGMFTLLMDRVPEEQRSGASALHFLTIYLTHAVAALSAGAAYARWGYSTVLLVAAAVALMGALLFRRMMEDR